MRKYMVTFQRVLGGYTSPPEKQKIVARNKKAANKAIKSIVEVLAYRPYRFECEVLDIEELFNE